MVGKIVGKRFYIDGKQVSEKKFWKAFPPQSMTGGQSLVGWKPLKSDGMAVHPSQIKEATEDALKKGVATEFTRDGRPILRTRQHRKDYMQAYGFFDKAGGYGDAQPGQTSREVPDRPDPGNLY